VSTSPAAVPDVNLWSESAHATNYIEHRREIPHRDEGYAAMLEFLPESVRRVADLGTGDGYVLDALRGARPGLRGTAVDFSAEMLRRARERFAGVDEVTVVEHDLDVPLPDSDWGRFDAVVSAFAIHHLTDPRKQALYDEVFGVLAPGGVFLNLEHVSSPTPELHDAFLYAINSSPDRDDPSNKLASVEDQLAWLRHAGFVQVDCHWKWRELALLGGVRPR
jgi:tRNA (cmo5U34)-methyltransferase